MLADTARGLLMANRTQVRFQIALPFEKVEELNLLAAQNGVSRTEYVRQILLDAIENNVKIGIRREKDDR